MKKHFAKLLIATLSIVFAVSLPTKDVNAAAKKNVTILIDPGHGGPASVDETGKAVPAVNDLTLWGNGNTVKGKTTVPAGYAGPIYAYVYNNFNLSSNIATAYVGM